MLQRNTFGMERKDGSRTAVGGSPIAAPTTKGDVIGELP